MTARPSLLAWAATLSRAVGGSLRTRVRVQELGRPALLGYSTLTDSTETAAPRGRTAKKSATESELLHETPIIQPLQPRKLTATIIGLPNAGKSSLLNALLNRKVCLVCNHVLSLLPT
jgi:hypothetical protein